MLPKSFLKVLPKIYQDKGEASTLALAEKMDSIFTAIENDIKSLGTLHDPVRCPYWILNELGYFLNADLKNIDTEAVKRQKIETAIESHKNGGTWNKSIKLIIDSVVGGNSVIVTYVGYDDFVVCGKGDEPAAYYWAGVGGKDDALPYGIYIYGKGYEEGIKGVVRIDVGSSTLTAAEVENLKSQILRFSPAYMIIILGYISGGIFTAYANGIIE
jgi:hypothetical protein